jgi:predicted dehydrogenase
MPFRLALLGVWHPHAPGMVRQIAAHPEEFELVGCWDADRAMVEQRRSQWSSLLPDLRWFDSADDLLDQQLDGVLVEGIVSENLSHARRALERHLPVLCEKPAGTTIAEAEATFALARRQGVHLQMAYLFRYMSAVEEMLRRAKRGDIGHVYEFRGRLPKDLPLYQEHVDTLGQYSGGIFFEMAGHAIDFMCSILGPPREITSVVGHHHPTRDGQFVDNGAALFGFEKALGIVEVPALEITPDQRRFEVYGTEGALIIPHLGSGHLANNAVQPLDVLSRDGKTWERLNLPAAVLQIRDLREFAAVVRGEKQPDYSPEHDLAVHAALVKSSGMA